MAYSIRISKTEKYIRADVSGNWNPGSELDDALNTWSAMAKYCKVQNTNRILSVWDVRGHLPTVAAYNLIGSLGKIGWEYRFRAAVVHLNENRLKDSLFVETVAINRGFQVKMFDNEESALRWLL